MSSPVRDRIVEATLRIIGRDGIAAVTNRRIATEAGVSPGSLTYHFATQADLLRETLLHFVSCETRRLTELAEQQRDNPLGLAAAAKLVGQVAASNRFSAEEIAPFELYIQAGRDPALRPTAAASFAGYDQLATTILTALGVREASAIAGTVVALISGLQLRRLATGEPGADLSEALLTLVGGIS
ncbi:MAG: TetR/AcrR family transcriptional regulator [Sciscionella sp.]